MTLRTIILLILLPLNSLWADSGLEFSGVCASPGNTIVLLKDKSTGASTWVAIGQDFGEYTVASYDAKDDVVVMSRQDVFTRLKLNCAKIQAGPVESPKSPEEIKEIKAKIRNNLRQICAASAQYCLENGVTSVELYKLVGVGPKAYLRELEPVDGESYAGIVWQDGKTLKVTTPSGIEVAFTM
jgi:hypothetical protein